MFPSNTLELPYDCISLYIFMKSVRAYEQWEPHQLNISVIYLKHTFLRLYLNVIRRNVKGMYQHRRYRYILTNFLEKVISYTHVTLNSPRYYLFILHTRKPAECNICNVIQIINIFVCRDEDPVADYLGRVKSSPL